MLSTPAIAQDQAAFATTDQSPFIQIYSLPSPAEGPVPGRGGWAWHFAFDVASNAIAEGPSAGERAVLSGESYRTSISLGYGLSERLTAAVMVPFVAHSSGMLDGFIRDWHDLFGLSNDRRDAVADYALNYSWAVQDDEPFALESRSRGLGDIRLALDRNLRDTLTDGRSLVLRSGVKLPTGSSSALRGSGSTDLSLQLLSTDRQALAAWNMSLSWMIGGLWLGDAEVLDERRRELVAIASIGVSRPVWRALVARVQLDGHSAFYDSDLRVLGASSVQITVGGSIALARADRIDFALVENLFTDSTPDFGVHVGWRDTF